MHKSFATLAIAALAFGAPACSKSRDKAPELQTQTPVRTIEQPKTIFGCLRSGVAENTFVLTASRSDGSTSTATYQLKPGPDVDLRGHAGQEVELSGVLETQQTVATSGEVQQKPAKGATGTPTVETKAEVDVRTFDVSSVKSTGNRCPE